MMKQQRGAVRAVMNMSLFLLLLLSGLLWSASGLLREYHYINTHMSWPEAQSYCRERFTDLATVDSMSDVSRLINVVDSGYSGSVWIGLMRASQSRWVWSIGDDTLAQYNAWDTAAQEPRPGVCSVFAGLVWRTLGCSVSAKVLCYNESAGFIKTGAILNSSDALSYCRQYHTDLPIIRSAEEQQRAKNISAVGYNWLGLFLDSWQWSDQWSRFFRNWDIGQPINSSVYGDCVAMSAASGKWAHDSCDLKRPFICYGYDKLIKRQIIRLNLSCGGKCDLNNSSLQAVILNKINEKMKSLGLQSNNITLRKIEGGEMFHMETNRTAESNITCDGN